jgi:hypothetical protein
MSYLEFYHLDKTSKKYICPKCHKKRMVAYVDAETRQPVNELLYGKCDRPNCGYHELVPIEKGTNKPQGRPDKAVLTIYPDEAKEMVKLWRQPSPLHTYLNSKVQIPYEYLYDIGILTKGSITVYVMRNAEGKIVNLKQMQYGPDGHRTKIKMRDGLEFDSLSLPQPKDDNEYVTERYTMCSFLEHLLDPEKKKIVCVVESEKSAAIARYFYPEHDWIGCSAASGLSDGSEGTSDKITPLKGRVVWWICDADKAGRGGMVTNRDTGLEEFRLPSSVRNLIKHEIDCHMVDLFPGRTDGWDIGDELLEGRKPELKPTWSRVQENPLYKSYIPPNRAQMLKEFTEGKATGESAHVQAIENIFSWKPGFVNCWTGWPNDGKSTYLMFLAVVRSKFENRKWCIWPPEMINSYLDSGRQVRISASDIYDELVFMLTGKSPYLHFEKKWGIKQMTQDEYMEAIDWVERHFYIINPRDRKYKDLIDNFRYFHEYHGCNDYIADPFKSLKQVEEGGRTDIILDDLFFEFKDLAVHTNATMNFIAHPRSQMEPKNKDGTFKVCTQHMLAGGASWNNNMDGIYSIYRPNRHDNPTDPVVHFYNLKQRKQQLVGRVGVYKDIEFDWNRNRYFFDGVCPVDGSLKAPVQTGFQFTQPWQKKSPDTKASPTVDFTQSSVSNDDVPF